MIRITDKFQRVQVFNHYQPYLFELPEQQDGEHVLDGHIWALLQLLGHELCEEDDIPVLQQDEVHEG